MPAIFFISETAPVNMHASSVVFYRHFKMLQDEGYKITWVTDKNSFDRSKHLVPVEWDTIILPNRSIFLPPYKAIGLLQAWRFYYYYHFFVKKALTDRSLKTVLITQIHGQFLSAFAAYLKARTALPLVSFFHDDPIDLLLHQNSTIAYNTEKTLVASDKILSVSDGLADKWPALKNKFELLYPLPEIYKAAQNELRPSTDTIVFGYSGAIYGELIACFSVFISVLETLGHKFIIIGDIKKTKFLEEQYPATVQCKDLFSTPKEANDYLTRHCSACLIPYPEHIERMPWIKGCFPSKFLQYCQLGLPTAIFAPDDSAIGKWCIENNWPLFYNNYKTENIISLISKLQAGFDTEILNRLKSEDFNPIVLHRKFKETIENV